MATSKIAELYIGVRADTRRFVRGMEQARKSTGMMAASANGLRNTMLKLGGVYAAYRFVREAVEAAIAFEKSIAEINTLLDSSSKQYLPQYINEIYRLTAAYGESAENLTHGLYDIISASISASQATKVLEVATRAAISGVTDTKISADALTTILNAYSMSADQAERVSDHLFTTVKLGKIRFAELAQGIGTAATLASSAGVKMTELLAAIASMTRVGMNADTVMTSLNAIITGFLSPAEDAVVAAKKYGLELSAVSLKVNGLANAVEKLKGLGPGQLAEIFPSIRALKGIMPLVQNYAGYMRDIGEYTKDVGANQKAFNEMADTTSFKIAKLKESLTNAYRGFGSYLIKGTTSHLEDWEKLKDAMTAAPLFNPSRYRIQQSLMSELEKTGYGRTGTLPSNYDPTTSIIGQAKARDEAIRSAADAARKARDEIRFLVETEDMEARAEEQKDLADAEKKRIENIGAMIDRMHEEQFTWALTAEQMEIYRLEALGADKATIRLAKAMSDNVKQARDMQESYDKLKSSAEGVWESTRTPMEQFKTRLQELIDMQNAGLINYDTLVRAGGQALAGLRNNQKPSLQAYETRFLVRAPGQDPVLRIQTQSEKHLANIERYLRKQGKSGVVELVGMD